MTAPIGSVIAALQRMDHARDGVLSLIDPRHHKHNYARPLRARLILSVLDGAYSGAPRRMVYFQNGLRDFGSYNAISSELHGLVETGLFSFERTQGDRRAKIVKLSAQLLDRCEGHAAAITDQLQHLSATLQTSLQIARQASA